MANKQPKDNVNLAILLLVGFGLFVPVTDAASKIVSEFIAPPQISLTRFVVQAIVIAAFFAIFARASLVRPKPLWPLIARGLCLATASVFLYAAFSVMPLIEAVAIYFVEPLILTALSAVFLRESVGWRRWLAVLVGMTGAMIIIGPNLEKVGTAAILPLLAAFFFAITALLTRRWAHVADLPMTLLVTALVAIVYLLLVVFIGSSAGMEGLRLRMPNADQWKLLGFVGIASILTTGMITQAFRIAPASVVAPFLYTEVVGAALVGYLIFADIPTQTTIFGSSLVVGAGLFVWWRENKRDAAQDHPS